MIQKFSGTERYVATEDLMMAVNAALTLARPLLVKWASPAGISMHMMPKRVANISGKRWGLVVTYADSLKPEQSEPVLQSATEFIAFVKKQEKLVQENGTWIVTTHPDSYEDSEKKILEDIKTICRKQNIPLFIVRGSELPNGWKRYDNTP